MQKHPMDTHGLSRSPVRAIFQNIPRNLQGGAGGPGQRAQRGAGQRPAFLGARGPPSAPGARGGAHAPLS